MIDYLKFTYRCEICGKFGTLKYDVVFNKNEKRIKEKIKWTNII